MDQTINLFYIGDYEAVINSILSCSTSLDDNEILLFHFRSLVHMDKYSDALDLLPNKSNSVSEALRLYLQAYQLGLQIGNPSPLKENKDFFYQSPSSTPEWNNIIKSCSDLISLSSSSSLNSPNSSSQATFVLAIIMDWAGRPDLSFQLSTRSIAQSSPTLEGSIRAEASLLQCSLLAQRGHWEILDNLLRRWRQNKKSPLKLDSIAFQLLEAQILILKKEFKRSTILLTSLSISKRSPKILSLLIMASLKQGKFADCEIFLNELKSSNFSSFYYSLFVIYSIQYQKMSSLTTIGVEIPPILMQWKKDQLSSFFDK